MDFVVTYDINTSTKEGERRLARVAKTCEGYGVRVQYSVFECRLNDMDLLRLKRELADVMDPRRDSIRFYKISGSLEEARTSMGRRPPHRWGKPWIV